MKFVYKTQIRKILFSKVPCLPCVPKKPKIAFLRKNYQFYGKFEKSVNTHFLKNCSFENCVITQNFISRKNFLLLRIFLRYA